MGNEDAAPSFITSTLVGGEWSASSPRHFNPEQRALGTHWAGDWEGPRASLDTTSTGTFLSPFGN
jgi:hypothetical protein